MRMVLGQVTVSSGRVAVVDAGLLRTWQGQQTVAQAAAAARNGHALFDYGGPNAAIVTGIPNGTLQIAGTKTLDGKNWRFLDLICNGDKVVAKTDDVGGLIVDEARVMISDLASLGGWKHDEAMDGKADVAFWGKDADELAAKMGAGKLPEGVWGWADLPIPEAESKFGALEQARAQGSKFMPDYRPHSHLFQAMAQVRASPFELGHVQVDGKTCFVAMTSWGDGVYPVLALRDAAGEVVAIRINLAREQSPEVMGVGQKVGVQAGLPPDPMTATKAAMGGAVAGMAANSARRAVVRQIKEYVPKPLWPLIPGEGGDVQANLVKLAKEKTWAVVSGCIISVLFFGFFALAILGFVAVVVYALLTS